MTRISFFILLCSQVIVPSFGVNDDENPLLGLASAFLQNMGDGNSDGMAALGGLVGTFMQGDNAKNLGSILGQNSDNAADVLSGIGSLFTNQDGSIDPSLVGSVISMFTQQMSNGANEKPKQKREASNDLNIESVLDVASSLLGSNAGGALPMIMTALSSFSNTEAEKRAHEHKDHASFLPPFLEKIHLYWDIFLNSEIGKTIWYKSGLQKAMKAFTGPDGKISFELMFKNFENHSFRRHWIKAAARYLTDTVVHMAKPDVYQRYLTSAQYIINSFLETQKFPKEKLFSVSKPEESITAVLDHVLVKHLDIKTDVSGYVKPAVDYIKQTLKMAQTVSTNLANRSDYNALVERLTDTLNLEVIEPVLRVYRAYRHSMQAPQCQEHLMCLVNRDRHTDKKGLPGFKAGLTKLSSFVASAALSFQNGKGFWDLYNAVQNDVNCEAKYPADCASFHEEELKVTTEIYHSEL